MIVELTDEQRDLLADLIDREIAQLGPEIRHTDAASYRAELKADRHVLREIRAHLEKPTPVTSSHPSI